MMTGLNRGRYTAQINGPWRLYTNTCPPGWQMLGTIQRGLEIGALALSPAGVLAQVNAGAVRPLNQSKATAALASAVQSVQQVKMCWREIVENKVCD